MLKWLNRISKLEEKVNNIIRYGTIIEVDVANNLVVVELENKLPTLPISYFVNSSGNATVYFAPKIGDQVIVIAQNGNINQRVAMPSIYKGNIAGGSDEWRLEFSSGSIIYKEGKLEIKAKGEVKLEAEKVILNGEDGGGAVGGNHLCSFTGTPHSQCSKKVFVGN